MDQWLGGRDSELTCVCSRTGVSTGREILILQLRGLRTFLCEDRYRSGAADNVSNEQLYVFILAVESLFKI